MAVLQRISKREAFKRFSAGKPVILCPCKFYPGGSFSMGFTCYPKEHLEKAKMYREMGSDLWAVSDEQTAWNLMYNNWRYYNTSHETGYYAHYYIEQGW